jgi:hypothetical protein
MRGLRRVITISDNLLLVTKQKNQLLIGILRKCVKKQWGIDPTLDS